jgi:hypothetical protein
LKLAVITLGWHYSEYFYKQITQQKIPEGWTIDLFCISHRDPSHAVNEKNLNDSNNVFHKLDKHFYSDIATIQSIESYGWKYMVKPNVYGDWSQFNQWVEDYDYTDYDVFMITGDDNFFITDTLFEDLLGSKASTIIDNGKVNGKHTPKQVDYNYEDWWVISNSVHMGRGVIRGSMEFIKREMFDVLGGKFDLDGYNSENRLGQTNSPSSYNSLDSIGWNKQVYPFMVTLEENNLYNKMRFLSSNYRVSDYCIEGERGMFINNNCTPYAHYYKNTVLELLDGGKLTKFI